MIIKLEKIPIKSKKDVEAINVTPIVEDVVEKSGVTNGIVFIFTTHTSSGLIVTEGLPCLEADILNHLEKLVPEDGDYRHMRYLDIDGRIAFNADTHIKSLLGGINTFFPIENKKIVKGSRQTIYFLEFDGPLERTFCIQVMGE